jgi:hypothetical protein
MAPRLFTALGALLYISLGFPTEVRADEPVPTVAYDNSAAPPPAARWRLLGYGAGLALGSYGVALAASYTYTSDPGVADLRIPVVGPWMKLGQTSLCPADSTVDPTCNNVYQVAGAILIGLDGLIQAGSLALLIQGVLMRTQSPEAGSTAQGRYGSRYPGYVAHDFGPSRANSPLAFQLGPMTLVPTFSSVRGAEASFGWLGVF